MTNTNKLAKAIMDMAEQDKGLVLSKLEELIEGHYGKSPVTAAKVIASGTVTTADMNFEIVEEPNG